MSGWSERSVRLEPGTPDYPPALQVLLGRDAPASLTAIGDPALLRVPLTALFCSVRVPPELVLPTYDLARALRDAEVPVIGGFQSPLERECLEYLLRGRGPVVVCPARDLGRLRLPRPWSDALEAGRMLIVTGFPTVRRPTDALAKRRNRLVTALAARVWLVHASPGGRLRRVSEEALAWGKPVLCPAHPENRDLILIGATAVEPILYPERAESARAGDPLRAGRLAPRAPPP